MKKQTWHGFLEFLQENVDADEMTQQPVTLEGILTYAGLYGIEGAEHHWKKLVEGGLK